jgi:Predicted membrane protein
MSGACALSCPYGLSCTAPGQCPRYVDSGGDGICDLGQPTTSSSSAESTSYDNDDSSTSASSSTSPDPTDTSSSVSSGSVNNSSDTNASAVADQGNGIDNGSIPDEPQYFTLPVSMLIIGLYLVTHFLFSKGILSRQKHRRIWNLLITIGMAGSGITGILLILFINLSIKTALNPSLTFWHVELSILMVIGTLIHLHLYRKPFKNMFRVLFGVKNFKVFKKPVSILAVVIVISMAVVSGQYLSSVDGNGEVTTATNSTSNNTTTSTATSDQYQDAPVTSTGTVPSSSTSDVQTYDTTDDIKDTTTTTTTSGGGKGKNKS